MRKEFMAQLHAPRVSVGIDIGDERLADAYSGFPRINLEVLSVLRLDPDDAVVFMRNRQK